MDNLASRYKNIIFFILIAIAGILGIYLGRITVKKYDIVVDAALGLVALYLLYQSLLSPNNKTKQSTSIHLEFPRDLKLLVYAFLLAILSYWAGSQVLSLIKYLTN